MILFLESMKSCLLNAVSQVILRHLVMFLGLYLSLLQISSVVVKIQVVSQTERVAALPIRTPHPPPLIAPPVALKKWVFHENEANPRA